MTRPVVLSANQPPARFYRGGAKIRAFRGAAAEGDRVPEDWVGSSTSVFGEPSLGLTTLPDGGTVRDAQAADPEGWFGPEHAAAWGSDPYLLVKLLDAGERLPVHLHPGDGFARQHLSAAHGKAEAWFVLDGGTIRLGWRRDVSPEEVAGWTEQQDVDAMLDAMHELRVERGDGVFVPAGMPHAIGSGIFVVEVQQPTDFSILLEWKGYATEGAALGHLGLGWEQALAAVGRSARTSEDLERLVVRAGSGPRVLPAVAERYFRVVRHDVECAGTLERGFRVLVATAGGGTLSGSGWDPVPVPAGTTVLVPWSAGELRIEGGVTLIDCRPPAVDATAARADGA